MIVMQRFWVSTGVRWSLNGIAITWPALYSDHAGCACKAIKKRRPSLQKREGERERKASLLFFFLCRAV
jgi:hypothetical protein